MTGFGAGEASAQGLSVRAEVRSVNHRHLQSKQRLPPEVAELEGEVEALVRRKLSRGSVTVNVQLERDGGGAASRIDADAVRDYHRQLQRLAEELGLDARIELQDVLWLPGVVVGRDGVAEGGRTGKLVLQSVAAALAELVRMREHEGAALGRDLERNAAVVERIVERIGKRMPRVVRDHQASLRRRVDELLGGPSRLDSAELAREVALLADRLDVSEELARLEAHLVQLRRLIEKGGPVGRKLDFLTQEFLREANTVGAKCNDAQVAHQVVELKAHIERLREQVQNVE